MRDPGRKLARLLILAGVILLVLLLMPEDGKPFCLALGLIAAGVCLLHRS